MLPSPTRTSQNTNRTQTETISVNLTQNLPTTKNIIAPPTNLNHELGRIKVNSGYLTSYRIPK